jgi:phosphoglycolate phosphatase-like HAD superfamily hydrolase
MVLFDVDMTLIRTNGAGRAAMDDALKTLFGLEQATAGISFDGRTDRAIFLEAIAVHGIAGDELEAIYGSILGGYLERLPGSLDRLGGQVLPGVPALLDALAVRRLPVGLATGNVREGARLKLSHFGLWGRFAAGGFGDGRTVRAELVAEGISSLAAAAGLDPDAEATLVIGDTPLDVEAAHAAGARALGVATGRSTVEQLLAAGAEHAVASLDDPSLLDFFSP